MARRPWWRRLPGLFLAGPLVSPDGPVVHDTDGPVVADDDNPDCCACHACYHPLIICDAEELVPVLYVRCSDAWSGVRRTNHHFCATVNTSVTLDALPAGGILAHSVSETLESCIVCHPWRPPLPTTCGCAWNFGDIHNVTATFHYTISNVPPGYNPADTHCADLFTNPSGHGTMTWSSSLNAFEGFDNHGRYVTAIDLLPGGLMTDGVCGFTLRVKQGDHSSGIHYGVIPNWDGTVGMGGDTHVQAGTNPASGACCDRLADPDECPTMSAIVLLTGWTQCYDPEVGWRSGTPDAWGNCPGIDCEEDLF